MGETAFVWDGRSGPAMPIVHHVKILRFAQDDNLLVILSDRRKIPAALLLSGRNDLNVIRIILVCLFHIGILEQNLLHFPIELY